MAAVALADIVVPSVFTPYSMNLTEEKARIVQSGAMVLNPLLSGMLAGGGGAEEASPVGSTYAASYRIPTWNDLANTEENYSATTGTTAPTPDGIDSALEQAYRLSRNKSWKSFDLLAALAGEDPMDRIASRTSYYWARRLQAAVIATMKGVNADNGVNDGGDYANDVAGASFVDGVTNFTAEAFIDTQQLMGDSQDNLALMMVPSTVYARMKKNNLIDFIPDARGETQIATYLEMAEVVIDDGLPEGAEIIRGDGTTAGEAGMYETWLFGPGALQWGQSAPLNATEVDRAPGDGNGGGAETLYNRVEWIVHPTGHAYEGAVPAASGPTNTQMETGANWNRVYPERKQIPYARLITREA